MLSGSVSRRHWIQNAAMGFGGLALAGMLQQDSRGADHGPDASASLPPDAALPRTHHVPKAKHVIFLFMSGGVSHVDSFDPKPELQRLHGRPMPMTVQRTQFNNNGNIMASPFSFRQWGESGTPISDLFPHLGNVADELAVVRSMTTPVNEHAQGNFVMHTGFPTMGYPSAGAWCAYGLGRLNEELPAYVVLQSGNAIAPHGGIGLFSNGYLPAQHQGSILSADRADAIRNIRRRQSADAQESR
ncbi:MAG: DUF1501 domain-containing protein, partial [Planctomycetota bacterium]